jgi:hypothetical protein
VCASLLDVKKSWNKQEEAKAQKFFFFFIFAFVFLAHKTLIAPSSSSS